jgi:hypothetical protein
MKMKFNLFIFSSLIVSNSFSQDVIFLHPFFTEKNAVLLPHIEGDWKMTDLDGTVSIHKSGDNFYSLQYGKEKQPATFEATFVKMNGTVLMDLCPVVPESVGDNDYRNSFLKIHTVYKAELTGNSLKLTDLNYAWFYDYAVKKKLPLAHEWSDNGILLTLQTSELDSFFAEQIDNKGFWGYPTNLSRKSSPIEIKKTANELSHGNKMPEDLSQSCMPAFPFKEGWMGGDGDVSVPISKTQTLFIFSDTYVGNKNQQNRSEPGLKMVSNTVAVETCLPGGKADVHYYWNNMYTENPQSIFKSFTSRYRYWVNSAFMYNNCLYVILQKVAHKHGVDPDDIFGFSLPGVSLAKITNPLAPPNQWNIELFPLPDFANPYMSIRCHAIQDNFIYFFVIQHENDDYQFLVRKKLDSIENTEAAFEYYALDKTWKTGIMAKDMDTLIHGFRANTVNYHADINKWVMVCDIKFFDNKIKIRTAPSLTGPWPEEDIVYKVPEVTPGTDSYSKNNFCYLSRECIQNYDPKTHTMLLTYDINNTSSTEINANPKIYTPKLITVSLRKYGSR